MTSPREIETADGGEAQGINLQGITLQKLQDVHAFHQPAFIQIFYSPMLGGGKLPVQVRHSGRADHLVWEIP